ncbi:MAG: response regulator [Phycisphaerales bacterium]
MSGALQDLRVLVVDDDPDIQAAMVLALRSEGAVVETADDGSVAIHQLQAFAPAVVVLDLMLPGQSGFTVLERAQRMTPPPKVVMVTANQGKRHAAYAESLGAMAYLNKPVPLSQLVQAVAAAGRA